MMRDKLGLFGVEDKDKFLILDLLTLDAPKESGLHQYFLSFDEFRYQK